MAKKFNIKDTELAQALEISLERVYDICNIFDADPDDDWELIEQEHFVWNNKHLKQRRFSPEGAFEICKYIDTHEGKNILRSLRRWLMGKDKKIRSMLVAKRIIEITDEPRAILFEEGKAFLYPRYARELLGLYRRQDILNRAFQEEQRGGLLSTNSRREPLQEGKHFIKRYEWDSRQKQEVARICFGGAGIARIGENLSRTLTQKHRREWCELVARQTPTALKEVVEEKDRWEVRVQKAMKRAKTHAKGRCQLTFRKKGPADPFDLAVHHVFDRKNYPYLADILENLIVIDAQIHNDFHSWMGGKQVSCTVDDLERYIEEFSASLFPDDNDGRMMFKAVQRINRIRQRVHPLV